AQGALPVARQGPADPEDAAAARGAGVLREGARVRQAGLAGLAAARRLATRAGALQESLRRLCRGAQARPALGRKLVALWRVPAGARPPKRSADLLRSRAQAQHRPPGS